MKKKYVKPETETVIVETNHFICISGKIEDWSSEKDDSDNDDWSDDNSNNSKSMNLLWEK